MMYCTIVIEAPTLPEQESIQQQLASAQIQVMNMHMESRWQAFDVDTKLVGQVLYLFPILAEVKGADNLSFYKELEKHEVELLMLQRQRVAIHDVQTVFHPYSGWQWALLLNYFDACGEQNRVLPLNKAANCEKLVFPDGGWYELRNVVTERSIGSGVLMPVRPNVAFSETETGDKLLF